MGRRTVDMETLAAVRADLRIATDALKSVAANLASGGINKVAEDEEPPAETGGDLGDTDLGDADIGDDLGDDFDEGTTGEEGGEGDLGDLDDMGGDMGGGFGGGGPGGGFGGGGLGEDIAPEGDTAGEGTAEVKAEVDGLRTELDAVKRTIVDISKNLRQIRNPLGNPASGNDAMQSV